jgi:hypothetical protein
MKKIVIEITFDDTDGYKGHGEDTAELIKSIITNELKVELESDGVIKPGWKVEVSDKTELQIWLEKRILQEQKNYEESTDVVDKASKGGKKKTLLDVLEFIKQH